MHTETELVRRIVNGPTMGTRYAAVFFADASFDSTELSLALCRAVEAVDAQMSTFRPDSSLMQLNRARVGEWFAVPRELFEVLSKAVEVGRLSGGAFDIGVGDLVLAWGFGAAAGALDPEAIASARNSRHTPAHLGLEFDAERGCVRKLEDISLDLSGIAKGYGVDALAAVLDAEGVQSYLVSIDGELRAGAPKPDGTAWKVALESPEPGHRRAAAVLDLENAAVATSGDYRQFVDHAGKRHSHTMDPRCRGPLAGGPASVTVGARTCTEADAWATAFMVLDAGRRAELASALQLEVIVAERLSSELAS
jgi:thiamine biosynthesis lipoprotein